MINNPYIEKVKEHIKILTNVSEIYKNIWSWKQFFWNNKELRLEIGTGLGNFFSKEVLANWDNNFLWMEIRYKRLYKTAEKTLGNLKTYSKNRLDSTWADNFMLLKDYWENIDKIFAENELEQTYIFFPDPWARKDRQKKNRLLQRAFLNNLYRVTKNWGKVLIKTDHREYFDFLLDELKATSWLIEKLSYNYESELCFDNSETTEFQQIFRWQNIQINYLELCK